MRIDGDNHLYALVTHSFGQFVDIGAVCECIGDVAVPEIGRPDPPGNAGASLCRGKPPFEVS